ncbi:hypothetical protein Pfo_007958 [Paulownia fortunei]|nr:hypothetical protein Pfo_007958 [Paulownia fortunei]
MLENSMLKAFPGTDIHEDPHINSKIYIWKKNYGSLFIMLSRSGFEWSDTTHMIVVDSDEVWEKYVKMDANARTMRFKSHLFYSSWCEIFGKDRATRENVKDCSAAANENLKTLGRDEGYTVGGIFDGRHQLFEDDTEFMLGDLAKRIRYEFDAFEKRTIMPEQLGKLGSSLIEKNYVAKLLVNNSKDLDLFFSLLDKARSEMVRMILSGQI